jgi:hypothetical protein
MANSDLVTPSREVLRIGDVAYGRAASEAIMSRFAATNNFIGKFQTDIKEFKLNGSYLVATDIDFLDGVASFFYNSEIVGVFFYNGEQGTSGTTEFDLRWINTSGVDQGSIFSVTPKISSAALQNAIGFRNLETSVDVAPSGVTLPTFSKTSFLQGESVYFRLASAMPEAQNCGLTIFYRPIN